MKKIILDLCGGTGAWSKPYADNGYDVRLITLPNYDVRTYKPPKNVYGILADKEHKKQIRKLRREILKRHSSVVVVGTLAVGIEDINSIFDKSLKGGLDL